MKSSIGVDIERISRFDIFVSNDGRYRLERIFSRAELEYSLSRPRANSHLAVRFCAKEAAIKALASLGIGNIGLEQIEIVTDGQGVPTMRIAGLSPCFDISVSMSHSVDHAVASVLITDGTQEEG